MRTLEETGHFYSPSQQVLEGWAQEPWESTRVFPVWAVDRRLVK